MFVKESDYSFCSVVGRTDVGCKRSVNEDSIGRADTPNGLAVVICDGMGGNVGGKTASETAVGAILQHLREHLYNNPQEAVSNAIQEANKAVLKKVSLRPELTGMGCTCVLLLIGKSGTVNIGHVGDSRIYLIRDGMANHLTKDQSYVQMLVDEGRLTPQEAEHHPRNNEITNAVGMMNMTPPVIRERAINPVAGDCFLLCSDGLSKLVPEEDIVKIVSARSFSTERRAEMLIDAAKNNGGSDNISVQLVEFSVSPAEVKLSKEKRRMIIIASAVVLSAILVLTGFFIVRSAGKGEQSHNAPIEITGTTEESENQITNSSTIGSTITSIPNMDEKVTSPEIDDDVANNDSCESEVGQETEESTATPASINDTQTDEIFKGKTYIFPAGDESYEIDPPRQNKWQKREYSRACCELDESNLCSYLDINTTEKGGLTIKKKKTDINWEGFTMKITKVIINKKPSPLQEKDCIRIIFK